MAQDRFGIYPATFIYAGPTTLHLKQIHDVSVDAGAKRERPIPGGALDAAATILNNADPMVHLKTKDLNSVFAAVSPSVGLACPTGGTVQFQKRVDGGAFAGTLSHVILTSTKGMLVPKTLSCDQDQDGGAELDLDYYAQYDGTLTANQPTVPLAIATSQTLVDTPTFLSKYFLGPIYLGAGLITAIVGWSLDFGLTYQTKRADGDLWPQVGSIVKRIPIFTFKILNTAYASTVSSLFVANPGSALTFYLRQGTSGGARLADNAASHIKLATATSGWCVDKMAVSNQDDVTTTILVYPTAAVSVSIVSTVP